MHPAQLPLPCPVLPLAAAAPAPGAAPSSSPHHPQVSVHTEAMAPNEEPATKNEELLGSPINSPINPLIHLSSNPLPLSALAALLGCTRSTIRHFADRLGFRYTVRRIGPRHKRTACLTQDQAALIAIDVERDAATQQTSSSSSSSPSETGVPGRGGAAAGSERRTTNEEQRTSASGLGHFYLLQLEPHHDPGRFKLGFSTNLESRLDDLRTVVPLARLIAIWPCHRSWERIAIVSTAQNAEPLSHEVFRCTHLEEAVTAANRFFAVMPKLSESPPRVVPPQSPKDRWRPTTDDPNLPGAAISRPRSGAATPDLSPPASPPIPIEPPPPAPPPPPPATAPAPIPCRAAAERSPAAPPANAFPPASAIHPVACALPGMGPP